MSVPQIGDRLGPYEYQPQLLRLKGEALAALGNREESRRALAESIEVATAHGSIGLVQRARELLDRIAAAQVR